MYPSMPPQSHNTPGSVDTHVASPSGTRPLEPGIGGGGGVDAAPPFTAAALESGMHDMLLSECGRLPALPQSLTPAPVTVLRSSSNSSQHLDMVSSMTTPPVAQQMVNMEPQPSATHPANLPGTVTEQQAVYRVPLVPPTSSPSSVPSYTASSMAPPLISLTGLPGLSSMPPSIRLPVAPTISLGPTPSVTTT